ncbi:MAG: hypothetical protein PHP04_06575 [Bacteroidales bacterium]|nr:hypothetical protein [Bacteroidales bacterium]
MKKILAIVAFLLIGAVSYAQWIGVPASNTITTDPIYTNAKIGVNVAPVSTFQAFNPSGACSFVASRNFTGASGSVGTFTIRNDATNDRFQILFRKTGGQHEILQTAWSSTISNFREFSYFNLVNGKWEMRAGVGDVEYQNAGAFLINSTGSVGIGLGSMAIPAGAKLAVGGKVVCKEVEVTLTGLPDYVFNENYKLRSLYEVESFVKENKHLPDVPCEAEVVANGMNVGQMNATLLLKIEELTLYMINLQKENDALKARISKLEK